MKFELAISREQSAISKELIADCSRLIAQS
jgi:hypothetical protein